MINYLSKFNYLSIKLITCQNKLIADQKLIDDYTKTIINLLLISLVFRHCDAFIQIQKEVIR